ncbi:hypothetical protein I6J18_00265 (plasmid) [Peribacillus psychrosaccharolyticus]|uniref:Uncharacterized protein n=1 Tax=Peribacillus psychrosaccharolyticus TaxID=1407 RepID=A0A974RYH2_PERPY|nr:hypothetical protein [Peribacillus psychrosaccharolyticus]MEC2054221.1 hypothetical protein [Peribacillus psychrosaccharolyticus]MED3746572.1 hypothetical protein [Peribacillus psychrosaccharolyticus]QQS98420.1 hypothetical protein I6J18_00265 [Peribacillus psychrosaccharolyticus]
MNKSEIINYLKSKIPDYSVEANVNKHILQYSVHVHPFITRGALHPFIKNLVNVLDKIEQALPDKNYAKTTIDRIASYNKDNFEQVIQTFSEITMLKRLVTVATPPATITFDPTAKKGGKNPEYRGLVKDIYFAIEVKTASLFNFTNARQTGLQITSRFKDEERDILNKGGKIVNSKALKVKDYLESADEKFEQYRQKEEYKDDFRLLCIFWDDYINEPLSALANPESGLLTENTFYKDSRFENVDGVIVIRHLHQFFRMLRYGEMVHYGQEGVHDAFDYVNPVVDSLYFQNPLGRRLPGEYLTLFQVSLYLEDDFHVAEYNPTDFVDWRSMISVTGMYKLPEEVRKKVLSYFLGRLSSNVKIPYEDIAFYGNISIDKIYVSLQEEDHDEKIFEEKFFSRIESSLNLSKGAANNPQTLKAVEMETRRRSFNNNFCMNAYVKNCLTPKEEDCPCGSTKSFETCCSVKLKYYDYTNYYDL